MGNHQCEISDSSRNGRLRSKRCAQRITHLEEAAAHNGPQSRVELALRERVKELDCLYKIATLRETHFYSADHFLQGVAECLPRSWQHPEHACARIVYGDKHYVTERFQNKQMADGRDILIDGQMAGTVEVFYRKVILCEADGRFCRKNMP